MAPVEATLGVAAQPISDSIRARELYKYYQPSTIDRDSNLSTIADDLHGTNSLDEPHVDSNVSTGKRSSPDTALTAFAQLVAWRTGSQRAMISVIDGATQYYIAESTRSLDLLDNARHSPGDDLWMGCSSGEKSGRLCERTLEVPRPKPGEYSSFVIQDMSADLRFNSLPFVAGPPHLKFYAGVPLITKRDIAIGSLFVVDERVRTISQDDIRFMGTMADTIMRHMEMTREVEEHRRGTKMSRGLASFVEGRSQLVEADVAGEDAEISIMDKMEIPAGPNQASSNSSKGRASGRNSRATSKVRTRTSSSMDRKERAYSAALLKKEESILDDSRVDPSVPNQPEHTSEPLQIASTDVGTSVTSPTSGAFGMGGIDKIGTPTSAEDSETQTMNHLFSRAANLIREAFEMDGGSVFFDAQKGFGSETNSNTDDLVSSLEGDVEQSRSGESLAATKKPGRSTSQTASGFSTTQSYTRRKGLDPQKTVDILGFSTPGASSLHGDTSPGPSVFGQFDEDSLYSLVRRYPRGKLWAFDEAGAVSSSSEDDGVDVRASIDEDLSKLRTHRRRKMARAEAEAKMLIKIFPGARQCLFVPMWDASRSRWLAGNFTWSKDPTRILSKQTELAFLVAFANSIMAEFTRIGTQVADQKKSDFIGSISHELRSPLHGILASAEFLGDEITESFSKGLVETIDSCGRTLLDTINHILDFSKINNFEKNYKRTIQRRAAASGPRSSIGSPGAMAMKQADVPMINLFAAIDLSIVCEEVIEGVFAGSVFQNMTASSFDMVPDAMGKMSTPRDKPLLSLKNGGRRNSTDLTEIAPSVAGNDHFDVSVILDISAYDYNFNSQPGALRRVIMNLLGNALKYTSHGYVLIKLEAIEMDGFQPIGAGPADIVPRSLVTLTVTDTGKGISKEFLRQKIFTPFCQESSLSSGTGLGLSIVRSIVSLLEGEIQITSELGRGTEVQVTFPLFREIPKDLSSGSAPRSAVSSSKSGHCEIIDQLRMRVIGKTASLHGFDTPDEENPLYMKAQSLLKESVTNFLINWFGVRVVPATEKSDIVIFNEPSKLAIERILASRPSGRRGPIIIALCSHHIRFDRAHSMPMENVGFLAKPVGPLKLARTLEQCLDGANVPTPAEAPQAKRTSSTLANATDLSNMFEDSTLSPVLDNSRMAAGSDNARKVMESPLPNAALEKHQEFPFPNVDVRSVPPVARRISADMEALHKARGIQMIPGNQAFLFGTDKKASAKDEPLATSVASIVPVMSKLPAASRELEPRLLLVDDNKINLRLLRTYMRKRRYETIDEAENGLEAVNAVQAVSEGYDIIFMDISMPVLDGFGATRQIRQIEKQRNADAVAKGEQQLQPALVIALTGLASSSDQSEAFTSGVDLFLTKPVSFKEVGRMLDNWQANKAREVQEQRVSEFGSRRGSGQEIKAG